MYILIGVCVCVCVLAHRGECTDSLRGRIRDLESECKKITQDTKLKEEQIRDLEVKAQVKSPHVTGSNEGLIQTSQYH